MWTTYWLYQEERTDIEGYIYNFFSFLFFSFFWKKGRKKKALMHLPPSRKLQTVSGRLETSWKHSRMICCCISSFWGKVLERSTLGLSVLLTRMSVYPLPFNHRIIFIPTSHTLFPLMLYFPLLVQYKHGARRTSKAGPSRDCWTQGWPWSSLSENAMEKTQSSTRD